MYTFVAYVLLDFECVILACVRGWFACGLRRVFRLFGC